jgi:hypothetical protein
MSEGGHTGRAEDEGRVDERLAKLVVEMYSGLCGMYEFVLGPRTYRECIYITS